MPTFENSYVENAVETLKSRIPVLQIHLKKNNINIGIIICIRFLIKIPKSHHNVQIVCILSER